MKEYTHTPVLINESIEYLNLGDNQIIVDATIGLGGHAKAILENSGDRTKLIGIDQDIDALLHAKENLKDFGHRLVTVRGNFADISSFLDNSNIKKIDGILLDLGLSSLQIDAAHRGFSLRKDGPLDMRMDKSLNQTAEDIVSKYSEPELENIINELGEERLSKRIAKGIVHYRKKENINTTFKLVSSIKRSIPRMNPKNETNIITRVFQAIRIKVNNELDALKTILNDSIAHLNKGGRIVVISYHSLEDRIVKEKFKLESKDCLCPPKQLKCTCTHKKKLNIITKKPIIPSEKEIEENPRSRSAKLRVAERI